MICPRCGPNATTYPGRWANECGSCRATLLNDDYTEQGWADNFDGKDTPKPDAEDE